MEHLTKVNGRRGQLGKTHAHRVARGRHPDKALSEGECNDPTHHVPVQRGSTDEGCSKGWEGGMVFWIFLQKC